MEIKQASPAGITFTATITMRQYDIDLVKEMTFIQSVNYVRALYPCLSLKETFHLVESIKTWAGTF